MIVPLISTWNSRNLMQQRFFFTLPASSQLASVLFSQEALAPFRFLRSGRGRSFPTSTFSRLRTLQNLPYHRRPCTCVRSSHCNYWAWIRAWVHRMSRSLFSDLFFIFFSSSFHSLSRPLTSQLNRATYFDIAVSDIKGFVAVGKHNIEVAFENANGVPLAVPVNIKDNAVPIPPFGRFSFLCLDLRSVLLSVASSSHPFSSILLFFPLLPEVQLLISGCRVCWHVQHHIHTHRSRCRVNVCSFEWWESSTKPLSYQCQTWYPPHFSSLPLSSNCSSPGSI